jgi:hypothetical protein
LFRKTEADSSIQATAKETTIIFNNLGNSFAAEFENVNTKDEVDELVNALMKNIKNNSSYRLNTLNGINDQFGDKDEGGFLN